MKGIVRIIASLLVCVLILVAGAWSTALYKRAHPVEEPGATPGHQDLQRANVRVEVAQPQTLSDVFSLTGHLEPWDEVHISAEVAGLIEFLEVEAGDKVEAGQELARIDTARIKATYDQAVARRTLAQQELERARELVHGGVAATQTLDQAEGSYRMAVAESNSVAIQLEKSRIYAPFSGILNTRNRRQSEYAEIGARLLHLVQTHRLKVVVGVPERDIHFLSLGDMVQLSVDAVPDSEFSGMVHRIAPAADMATRTFRVEIDVENEAALLSPGMTARARIIRQSVENAVVCGLDCGWGTLCCRRRSGRYPSAAC